LNGQIRFSPGNGFSFGKRGGSFTNTFLFSTIGNNVSAVNYGWEYSNSNPNYVLNSNVTITDNKGVIVYSKEYTYPGVTEYVKKDYTYNLSSNYELSGLKVIFTSNEVNDKSNWAGPNVRNIYTNVIYEENKCDVDVLSSASCKGYTRALVQKACDVSPQSSPECDGYRFTLPATTSPITDSIQTDFVKSLTNPLYMLIPSTGNKTGINTEPQKQNNNVREVRRNIVAAVVRNTNASDPQTEKLADMQSGAPNISAYTNSVISDAAFYKPREIYRNVRIQDNATAQRQLTQRSNISHGRMVDEQYRR
jgi:hypothetical protein